MSLDNELSKIETIIIGCEKELKNASFNASAITSRLRGIADPATRTAKGNELAGWLAGKSETIDIERLLELKNQNPDNSRVGELGRRAVNYCAALQDIIISVIQTMDSPSEEAVAAKKQALALKDVMAHIKRLFSETPPAPAQVTPPQSASNEAPTGETAIPQQ